MTGDGPSANRDESSSLSVSVFPHHESAQEDAREDSRLFFFLREEFI